MSTHILVDHLEDGRKAAALVRDGALFDLLIDPRQDDLTPQVGAIYSAIAGRPLKGQGGMIVSLPDGQTGFLRQTKGLSPGEALLVQVATSAEKGKAPPVNQRLLIKGHFAILTPGAKGRNIARSIHDEERRVELADLLSDGLDGLDDSIGAIMRTAAAEASDAAILDDIGALREITTSILHGKSSAPELLLDAADAQTQAYMNWATSADIKIDDSKGSFESLDVWSAIEALKFPHVPLGTAGWMSIEPTSALTAVDVNTGAATNQSAGLAANIACAEALPTQLRLRGLGGQIVIDFAPMGKKDRRAVETALKKALRADGIETSLAGWTPLGHLELNRKRERRPLKELL